MIAPFFLLDFGEARGELASTLDGKSGKKAPPPAELVPSAVWFGISGQAPETLTRHGLPTQLKVRVEFRRLILSLEEFHPDRTNVGAVSEDSDIVSYDAEGCLTVFRMAFLSCLGEFEPI